MGKRRLCTGIIFGAIIGGIITLFNKEARDYASDKLTKVKNEAGYMIKNPTETVHNTRVTFEKLHANFSNGAENAMNALEQVEQTLGKLENKSN